MELETISVIQLLLSIQLLLFYLFTFLEHLIRVVLTIKTIG